MILAIILSTLFLVILSLWRAYAMATRLHRLHIRTDKARISLEHALSVRAAVVAILDPSLEKRAQATASLPLKANDMGARSDVDNALIRDLAPRITQDPRYMEATTRVDVCARFYNDAVQDTRTLRRRMSVRLLRLYGFAPLPEFYEGRVMGAQN